MMTAYGIYDLDGSETSLPHPLNLTSSAYERLTEHYPEIGLWCIAHQMRVETVENTDLRDMSERIAEIDKVRDEHPREDLTQKFVDMMLKRAAYTLFFATPEAAFEFKVRWL